MPHGWKSEENHNRGAPFFWGEKETKFLKLNF
jgi:hypothetical protein